MVLAVVFVFLRVFYRYEEIQDEVLRTLDERKKK